MGSILIKLHCSLHMFSTTFKNQSAERCQTLTLNKLIYENITVLLWLEEKRITYKGFTQFFVAVLQDKQLQICSDCSKQYK